MLFSNSFKLEVFPNKIKLTEQSSGACFEDSPAIAIETIDDMRIVAAIGMSAEALNGLPHVDVRTPFLNNGKFYDDAEAAFAIINHAMFSLKESVPKKLFAPKLLVIRSFDVGQFAVRDEDLANLSKACGFAKSALSD